MIFDVHIQKFPSTKDLATRRRRRVTSAGIHAPSGGVSHVNSLFTSWLCWVFIAARAFSSCSQWAATPRCAGLLFVVASLVAEHGLQLPGLQQLRCEGSVFVAPRLQGTGSVVVACRLSCSSAINWDLPGPGIKPMSSALAVTREVHMGTLETGIPAESFTFYPPAPRCTRIL